MARPKRGPPLAKLKARRAKALSRTWAGSDARGEPHRDPKLRDDWRGRKGFAKEPKRGYKFSEEGRARLQRMADQLKEDESPEARKVVESLLYFEKAPGRGGKTSAGSRRLDSEDIKAAIRRFVEQRVESKRPLRGLAGILRKKPPKEIPWPAGGPWSEGHLRKVLPEIIAEVLADRKARLE